MHRVAFIILFLTGSLLAAETGPTLFSGTTDQVSGFFHLDKNKVVNIEQGDGAKCTFSVQRIKHHHAGDGFSGWHVEYQLEHSKLEEKSEAISYDFFWNEKELGIPFSNGFKSSYEYHSPVYDPPYRQEMVEDNGSVTLKVTGFGGFTWTHFVLTPTADLSQLTRFEKISIVFGKLSQHIVCNLGAN